MVVKSVESGVRCSSTDDFPTLILKLPHQVVIIAQVCLGSLVGGAGTPLSSVKVTMGASWL